MKRGLDILLTLALAPLWVPLIVLIALCVRLLDGAPVFFRQTRAGLHGKPFPLLKFRTMRAGTGNDLERLTRLGRLLRATSLDELPQLFQVLGGSLSLVGPRPLPVEYISRYTPEQARRLTVTPGLTGWAQIHGRNAISWEEKFKLDIWYVDHRTFLLDIKILLLTIVEVAARTGVNHSENETMPAFRG